MGVSSNYLNMCVSMMHHETSPILTPMQYVLKYGKQYDPAKPQRCKRGEMKMCFKNALELSARRGLKYVEGWAHRFIPTQHAWCVDDKGRIYEPTWDEVGSDYFGVELGLSTLIKVQSATGYYGVFGSWEYWDKILPLLPQKSDLDNQAVMADRHFAKPRKTQSAI